VIEMLDYIPKIVAFAAPIAVVIMMLTGVVYAWRVRLEKIWISLWVLASGKLADLPGATHEGFWPSPQVPEIKLTTIMGMKEARQRGVIDDQAR
jgi:hypothetical protein